MLEVYLVFTGAFITAWMISMLVLCWLTTRRFVIKWWSKRGMEAAKIYLEEFSKEEDKKEFEEWKKEKLDKELKEKYDILGI